MWEKSNDRNYNWVKKKSGKDRWLGSVIIHQQEQLAVVSLSFKILHCCL